MLRPAYRAALRAPVVRPRVPRTTRFLSTAPPHLKSRSWKNSAARWTAAFGAIYIYNTSSLFAEEPAPNALREPPSPDDDSLPTLASLSPSSRFKPPHPEDPPLVPLIPTPSSPPSLDPKAPMPGSDELTPQHPPSSPESLEEDAAQQGAFNEETGEINWDCPCLGGMAHGPCGPEFREAFSCFVFSKEEPKGMDCIEKFKGMQECFQRHPEEYAAELADDDDFEGLEVEGQGALAKEGGTALKEKDEGAHVAAALPEDSHHVAAVHAEREKKKENEKKDEKESDGKKKESGSTELFSAESKESSTDKPGEHITASIVQSPSEKKEAKPAQKPAADETIPRAAFDATSPDKQGRKNEQ